MRGPLPRAPRQLGSRQSRAPLYRHSTLHHASAPGSTMRLGARMIPVARRRQRQAALSRGTTSSDPRLFPGSGRRSMHARSSPLNARQSPALAALQQTQRLRPHSLRHYRKCSRETDAFAVSDLRQYPERSRCIPGRGRGMRSRPQRLGEPCPCRWCLQYSRENRRFGGAQPQR